MRDIGRKTNSMDKERKPGPMVLSTRVTMLMAKRTEEAASDGLMAQHIKANSLTITSTVKVYISGLILASTMVNGKTTKCMARVCSLGLMAESMRATTMMIRSRVMVFSHGQMAADTMVNGSMESNTERAPILHRKETSSVENGKTERELDG
jgi:hypothetical protein